MKREKFNEIWESLRRHDDNKSYAVEVGKEELYDLVNIVEDINPQIIMEIGVLVGGTLKFWEQLLPVGGLLIGLDIQRHIIRSPSWKYENSDRNINMIIDDSLNPSALQKTKELLGDNRLDFLFIDGNHDIRHVLSDFQIFGSLVRNGGIIGFDDLYNIEGGAARALFPLLSHANEWILPTIDGVSSGIDIQPYAQKTSLYTALYGKIMAIYHGGAGVGILWKE